MRNGSEYAAHTVHPAAVATVPVEADTADAGQETVGLHAQVAATRRQSRALAVRLRAAQHTTAETVQLISAALNRTGEIHQLRLAARTGRMRFSAHARMEARLASMPVIEQAKGIIMAQCRCSEDQAFDALRRASQRENIKLRELAARVVAKTAGPASR